MTRRGEQSARVLKRASVMLRSHEGLADEASGKLLDCRRETVFCLRKRYVNEGLANVLEDRARPGVTPKLNAKGEAHLIALACSDAPEGRESWTMQLLAEQVIELGIVEGISDETVRRTLKKKTQTLA